MDTNILVIQKLSQYDDACKAHLKLKTEAELIKSVVYKKACILSYIVQ